MRREKEKGITEEHARNSRHSRGIGMLQWKTMELEFKLMHQGYDILLSYVSLGSPNKEG